MTGLLALLLAAPAAADRKPNVVWVVADDLGSADVGFRGCTDIPTPHLDALAAGGVRCTHGYVAHPFCSPTRAALLTGKYQHRFGHENNPAWLPDDPSVGLPLAEATAADLLAKAGYATGWVGKWHLGAHPSFHPNRRGFADAFGFLGGGRQYFDRDRGKGAAEYAQPLLRNQTPVREAEYLTDAFGREAAAFVDRHQGTPFFLYLAFNAPHTPLQAPKKYLDRVAGIADERRRTYAAMVVGVDEAVGRLLGKLREHGLDRDTLVVFLSDNGGPTAVNASRNAPLRGGKGQVYDGGIRVPFVVRWPARLQPGRFDGPVICQDLLPTAVAAAGAAPPAGLDGIDLLPHLTGANPLPDRPLVWRVSGSKPWAVRRGPLKLVQPANGPAELYDLAADPGEATDLAAAHPERVAALTADFTAWSANTVPPRWKSAAQSKK